MDSRRDPGLTVKARCAGWAAKIGPGDLDQLLSGIDFPANDRVLVGMSRPDDAGVYLLRPDLALVQTVDVIAPIADDPFDFGRIAAANALSDVYAMGGTPVTALAILGFPVRDEAPSTFRRLLQGALATLGEADCALLGGHSLDDPELKFGLAVTGTVDPSRILAKGGARPGDALVLTKGLGTGVVSTALKNGAATDEVFAVALRSMTRLNKDAAQAAVRAGATAMTDVTGFGFLGHLREMVVASSLAAEIRVADVPILEGARPLAAAGWSPGGTTRNREFVASWCEGLDGLDAADAALLCDPQTSGGLLVALPADGALALVERLRVEGHAAAVVGRMVDGAPRLVLL